jgi:hypothetical protein
VNLKHLITRSLLKTAELRAFVSEAVKTDTQRNDSPALEALEQRIMMSASPIAVAAEAEMPPQAEGATDSSDAEQSNQQTRTNLVFIDSAVDDLDQLLSDFSQQSDVEVVVLDANRDGIDQISAVLAQRSAVESLHIVSHGSEGNVQLGNTRLNSDTISQYAGDIARWNTALTTDADLLIYGCDLAATADGRTLVESVSALTGADVAASDDLTGHVSLGGDWVFEYTVGDVEASVIFSADLQASYLSTFATVTVDSTADVVNGNISSIANLQNNDGGDGISLREAILAVNSDPSPETHTLELVSGTYLLDRFGGSDGAGDLDIRSDVIITGQADGSTIIEVANGLGERVFQISEGESTFSNLTIQGGAPSSGSGGGILVGGGTTLTLDRVVVTGNTAAEGGGIQNLGNLIITNSTISNNSASRDGGAIASTGPTLDLDTVTISGNTGQDRGGGVYSGSGQVTFNNVTLSGNSAAIGGGLSNTGADVEISSATITQNTATDQGGGISAVAGSVLLDNTIVAGNTAGIETEVRGPITSQGNNIIGDDPGNSTGGTGYQPTDLLDQTGLWLDPVLANNGGPVQTHALLPGSVGINPAGPNVGAIIPTANPVAVPDTLLVSTGSTADINGPSGRVTFENEDVGVFGDLTLEDGNGLVVTTEVTVTDVIDFSAFTSVDANNDALHIVGAPITLGGFDLLAGDVLFSTDTVETYTSINSLVLDSNNIYAFRPAIAGDYSSGEFYLVVDASALGLAGPVNGFSLVETDTTVGVQSLSRGDFIYSTENSRNIFWFDSSTGSTDILIPAASLGALSSANAIELIESDFQIGGIDLNSGDVLISTAGSFTVGSNDLLVSDDDVVLLRVAPDMTATASVLLDGSDVFMDSDGIDSLAIAATAVPIGSANVDLDADDDSGVAGNDYATTFTGAPVLIADSDAAVTSPDSTTIDRMFVIIENAGDATAESLSVDTSAFPGIDAVYDPSTSVLRIAGTGSLADYQAIIRAVQYNHSSPTASDVDRSIVVLAYDSLGNGLTPVSRATINFDLPNPPTVISSGIELNTDGGNDAYLSSDSGISQDLSASTIEVRFAAEDADNGNAPAFFSYNTGQDLLTLSIDAATNGLEIDFGTSDPVIATERDYRVELLDGDVHTLSVTWDNQNGDWSVYIDGQFIQSGSGLSTGETIDAVSGRFVLGNDQDTLDGGYDVDQRFAGTFYDARVWSEARSAIEIEQDYDKIFSPTALPSGLEANWQFDRFDGMGDVVEIVNGNNLSVEHATGNGFLPSTPVDDLNVDENSANGTSVGFVIANGNQALRSVDDILASDPALVYDATTGKFYKAFSGDYRWAEANSAATATDLFGASGQLVTIDSQAENDIVQGLANALATPEDVWIGASDQNVEGNWHWYEDGVQNNDDLFWVGDETGSAANGRFSNWVANEPSGNNPNENFARLQRLTGQWRDSDGDLSMYSYVVEWDAAEVFGSGTQTFALIDDANGRFQIDSATGEITVADGSQLDFEADTSHEVIVEVTSEGGPYSEGFTIEVNNVNEAPVIDNLDGDVVDFEVGDPETLLDVGGDLLVSDVDSANFDGGLLKVTIVNADLAEDELSILSVGDGPGEIAYAGTAVSYEGNIIGTVFRGTFQSVDSGIVTSTLFVSLDANADQAAVTALLKSVSYNNIDTVDPNTTSRIVEFDLSDGDGATSTVSTAVINFGANAAPESLGSTVVANENDAMVPFTIRGSDTDGTIDGFNILTLPTNGTVFTDAGLSMPLTTGVLDASSSSVVLYYVPNAAFSGLDGFEFAAIDNLGLEDPSPDSVSISVEAINDPPVLDNIEPTTSYTENDGPLQVAGNLMITDIDSPTLTFASVEVLNFVPGEDVLTFTTPATIIAQYDAVNGSIRFAGTGVGGTAPVADFQSALQSVAFENISEDPSALTRTFRFEVNDGESGSNVVERDINVNPINDAPEGADNTITISEDATHVLTPADFGFSDVDGDAFRRVFIDQLPSNGQLLFLGNTFNAGSFVSIFDLGNGNFIYQPNVDQSGIGFDSFLFSVADDGGTVNGGLDRDQTPQTMTFNVDAVNDAPTTTPVVLDAIAEDSGVRLITEQQLLANADDVDGDVLAVTGLTITNGNGDLVDNLDGTWSYTPALNDDGDVSFSYNVTDGVDSVPGLATLDITPVNDAPVALNNALSISEDTSFTGPLSNLLLNDSDVEGDTLSITPTAVSGPSDGALTFNGDGTFTFTPDTNFNGLDSFVYEVTDGNGGAAQATVNITVRPVNDAPVASDDSYSTNEDTTLSVITGGVLDNDTDVDDANNDLVVTQLSDTTNGTLTLNADGTFDYVPDADFAGTDSFTYQLIDPSGAASAVATVTITVGPANDAPVLSADTEVTVEENTTFVGTFSGTDVDGDTLTYSLTGIDAGLFNINSATGAVTFASSPDAENPSDSDGNNRYEITVEVTDNGTGMLTSRQNVAVTVIDVNEFDVTAPTDSDATPNEVEENVAAGTVVGLTAEAFDFDATDNTVTYRLVGNPEGLFQIDANTGVVTTLDELDFEIHGATRTIVIEAASSDGSTETQAFTIAIGDLEEFPVGDVTDVDLTPNSVAENSAVGTSVGITTNAFDADLTNSTVTYALQNDDGGRFAINPVTGEITVAANIDFEIDGESRSVTVRAQSEDGSFADQIFTVEIVDVNEAPTVAITGVVLSVADDADTTDGIRIANIEITDDALGTNNLSLSGADADVFEIVGNELRLRQGAELDFESKPQFDVNVEVDDPLVGASPDDLVSHTLNVLSAAGAAPVIEPGQVFSVAENSDIGTAVGNVVVTDATDARTTPLGPWSIVGGNEDGNFTIDSATGTISVVDNSNLDFERSVSYELVLAVSRGNQLSAEESVRVNVLDVNEAPVASDDTFFVDQFGEITVLDSGVLRNDVDQDGDPLTATLVSEPEQGILTLNPDGSANYVALGSFTGSDFFTYRVSDGVNAGTLATVEIVVVAADLPSPGGPGGPNGISPDGANGPDNSSVPNTGAPTIPIMELKTSSDLEDPVETELENTVEGNLNPETRLHGGTSSQTEPEPEPEAEIVDALFNVSSDTNFRDEQSNDSQESLEARLRNLRKLGLAGSGSLGYASSQVASVPLAVTFSDHSSELTESSQEKLGKISSGTYAVTTASLSVGYVLWLIRGGSLLASFTSALPAWTSMDPLSIVAVTEKDEEDSKDNESLLEMVNNQPNA